MSRMLSVTDAAFEQEVAQSSGVVLVDVWAAWCPPCRVIKPILEELAGSYEGQARILTLDADDNPETASRFAVRSLPTVLFFRDGVLQDRLVGALPKGAFQQKIVSLLGAVV
jgi:thioredoxin 1